jgi:hypothetical protein
MEADERQAKAAIYGLNRAGGRTRELEEAWIIQALGREDALSQVEVAELLERHKSWVCRRLALIERLGPKAKDELRVGLLTPTAARQIVRLPQGNQTEVLEAIRREEQAMLTTSLLPFPVGDERSECGKPLLAALQQVLSGERIGEFLQARRIAALQKRVGALLKVDALFSHPNRQPMVLVEAHPRGKWKIGTHAYEHAAPSLIVQIEVELIDPALLELQVGAVVILSSNRH